MLPTHLRSTSDEIRSHLNHAFVARDIASSLISIDVDSPAGTARALMRAKGFDAVGVRTQGVVTHYVEAHAITGPSIDDEICEIADEKVIAETTSLRTVVTLLEQEPRLFVRSLGQIGGIITRADLQKVTIRMWLFGVLSLIEMQMMRVILQRYPNDSWKLHLKPEALSKAEEIHRDRARRDLETSLADCLAWSTKARLVCAVDDVRIALGFVSKGKGSRMFSRLQALRDRLAHAHVLITGSDRDPCVLGREAEALLDRFEALA